MDPITAMLLATKAVAELITEIVKGQPLDVKKQIWTWFIEDQTRWRTLLRLDGLPQPKILERVEGGQHDEHS